MDINDLHPPDDYSHRFFIWHEWIQANGLLTAENVLSYFATSMFYDKQSNNEVLKMQTDYAGAAPIDVAAELRRFVGVEFSVVHAEPPTFFIIHKRERLSPDEVRPLAVYFIMNNRIYQSPDVYTVLSNRLLTSVSALQSSLDILRKHRPDYTPRTGFGWPITDPSVLDSHKKRDAESNLVDGEGEHEIPQEKRPDVPKKQQNNILLIHAMKTTAAHSKTSFSASRFAENIESLAADTPVSTTMRSSVTPAPSVQEATQTQKSSSGPSQEPAKGPPGGGKKKKKRASLAPLPGPN